MNNLEKYKQNLTLEQVIEIIDSEMFEGESFCRTVCPNSLGEKGSCKLPDDKLHPDICREQIKAWLLTNIDDVETGMPPCETCQHRCQEWRNYEEVEK